MSFIRNEAVPYKGTVKSTTDTGITVQINGRLGLLEVPWRMVLSENKVEVGQTVFFTLSLLEVQN